MAPNQDVSNRIPWPPILAATLLLVGSALSWAAPIPFLPDGAVWLWRTIGLAIGLCGIALGLAANAQFRRAGKSVRVDRASSALVETGPFRYSRNPLYVATALVILAVAVGFNSLWLLLAVPLFVIAVQKLAIEREEVYLERKFGESYRAYRRRVPRWFGVGAVHDKA